MPRGNSENLIKNSEQTPEQRRARASKAGKASVAARRERKSFRETLQTLLELRIEDPDNPQFAGTTQELLSVKLIGRALTDNEAFKIIRDTIGEKPTDRINATMECENKELLKSYLGALKK